MKALSEKQYGLWTAIDYKKTKNKLMYAVMAFILLALSVVCLFPPVWLLLSSFKDVKEFLSIPPTLFPKSFHPEKLVEVWNSMSFWKYYLNTLTMAAGDLTVCLISTGLGGYVLSRMRPKGIKAVFALIMWTMMMPNSISMVPLFMSFIDYTPLHLNLTNTYIPMWMMAGANTFYILVFKSFFDGIPISYVEAARIDGCSDGGIFTRIILPLSKPVLMVIGIFSLNGSWENFMWPYLILKDPKFYTVAVQIFSMKNSSWAVDSYICALVFAILPPAILFIIFQKHIMTGFTMGGGVKG